MDLRICGDLRKYRLFLLMYIVEKNKKLDEFFMAQSLDG
jgi:hypothetical protein